ncbi:uncharacterized protein LOC125030958 [Penaeus chinensis]|uniref:uncharacterized protein LOC125030958 n=1 Tax=Penaeus chinensis TaxID=139456 RepID=UPI001FB851F0|nr:uncharacterized protein LOC125030958 [Penaeus chinensis]
MMKSSSFLLIALVALLKNIEGERNTLTLKVIVGYKVAPVIATFSARSRLACAAGCVQNQACDVYDYKDKSNSNNCNIAALNVDTYFEQDSDSICYVPVGAVISLRNEQHGLWGRWSAYQYCDEGSFVYGLRAWTDEYGGPGLAQDDCGMTGLELYCKDLAGTVTTPIKFNLGFSDAVVRPQDTCQGGTFALGFRMKWLGDQGDEDDVAMTTFRLHCQTGTAQSYGDLQGTWYSAAMCPPESLICGFRVLYQLLTVDDVTCFNEVVMACCFP